MSSTLLKIRLVIKCACTLNNETKLEDRIKVGDKIEAMVTSEGHARSITVQIPLDSTMPRFKTRKRTVRDNPDETIQLWETATLNESPLTAI